MTELCPLRASRPAATLSLWFAHRIIRKPRHTFRSDALELGLRLGFTQPFGAALLKPAAGRLYFGAVVVDPANQFPYLLQEHHAQRGEAVFGARWKCFRMF